MLALILDGRGARASWAAALLTLATFSGCGAKTSPTGEVDAAPAPEPEVERCNGADDDFDDAIDEDFRDEDGHYLDDAHCGRCNQACAPASAVELSARCSLLDGVPTCVAGQCADGFVVGTRGRCVSLGGGLCLECGDDQDCGTAPGARCADVGGESRCVVGCAAGCPDGYRCEAGECRPEGGSCRCEAGDDFEVACAAAPGAEPDDAPCIGRAQCRDGVLGECRTSEDVCDQVDNDCDGVVDQAYVDERGAYGVDIDHCGQCGVSCREDTGTDFALRCGGDPFAPSCVVECEDAFDGEQPGDMLDGDFDITNGCECLFSAANDEPGPVGLEGARLDVDCDGADGEVVQSYYVASDGDDEGPGSPTRPLRSLGEAFARAVSSRDEAGERSDIYVAGGTYTEVLEVPAGVRIHGGYRRDFRRLDRAAFETEIRAEAGATLGAALVAYGESDEPTVIEGLTLRGSDAASAAQPAVAAVLVDAGNELIFRDSILIAGLPGEGNAGSDGNAGSAPSSEAEDGQPPRSAVENASHTCVSGPDNVVQGGAPGRNTCGGQSVAGGQGGSASCPVADRFSGPGRDAPGARVAAGFGGGGAGGQASSGPLTQQDPNTCPSPPCCGLADFRVSGTFSGPEPGQPGEVGSAGTGGDGCSDAFGDFATGLSWSAGAADAGEAGSAGGGGGGGGAGGGSQFAWDDRGCEYADGLGGGGGGGGAGGCGGQGGRAGGSGAPSVALLVVDPRGAGPRLSGLSLSTAGGSRGGPGGAGGEGGAGGSGAFGGELSSAELTLPPLSASFPGARGGKGGAGGSGGGGGGGCGGASVGIWVVNGSASGDWRSDNTFELGEAGAAGAGGAGGEAGGAGLEGGRADVHVQ